jgi:hypothetical protein
MGLPDEDHRALLTRLAPAGTAAADKVAGAFDEGEELREIVVDAQGDVVAFTDRRALFVARGGAADVVPVGYDAIELRKRDSGLAIDVLMEGGRLIVDVARGTFARLAVVGTGAPPGRASWLPIHQPPPRPEPAPPPPAPAFPSTPTVSNPPPPTPAVAGPPLTPTLASTPAPHQPAHAPRPTPPPPGLPPAGWHPDPAGRHWWRWWDGVDWTEHVADGGSPFVDPLPPRG